MGKGAQGIGRKAHVSERVRTRCQSLSSCANLLLIQKMVEKNLSNLYFLLCSCSSIRCEMRSRLEVLNGEPGSWKHLTTQRGIFSILGLSPEQCRFLTQEKHIYIYESGRMNMAAVNMNNVEYVCKSMDEAYKMKKRQ